VKIRGKGFSLGVPRLLGNARGGCPSCEGKLDLKLTWEVFSEDVQGYPAKTLPVRGRDEGEERKVMVIRKDGGSSRESEALREKSLLNVRAGTGGRHIVSGG